MNKWRVLAYENREERPRDRDGSGQISLCGRECVCGCCSLKEESSEEKRISKATKRKRRESLQSEENENLCPDTRRVLRGIGAESFECREYNKDSRPAVVKRKGKMNEEFIQAV